jgi:hypothetical protein
MSRTFHAEPQEHELDTDPAYQELVRLYGKQEVQALIEAYSLEAQASVLVQKLHTARDAYIYTCKNRITAPEDMRVLFRYNRIIKRAEARERRRVGGTR